MKHVKLFENFFSDIETAATTAHSPVFARTEKPEEVEVGEIEPDETEDSIDTPRDKEPEPKSTEPKSFGDWLKRHVKEVVEFTETPKSTKVWVKINNGVSVQWEISMEDYPFVSASFNFGADTVYLDDDTAGEIAKEFYDKKREYNPEDWAEAMIASAKALPDMKRDWEKRAINRATDQDQEFSIVIADKFGTQKTD
jgi:hypothetical protein